MTEIITVPTRMTVRAEDLIAGDVIMGISCYESFVVEEDVKPAYQNHGIWVVDVIGDTEDGDVKRETGEYEMLMVIANDELEIIRGAA